MGERKRISRDTRWYRFIVYFFALGAAGIFITIWMEGTIAGQETLVILSFIVISLILARRFHNSCRVEFDDSYMYILTSREEEKVPLKDVLKIKLTMAEVNRRSVYKISYHNASGQEKSVRILPSLYGSDFDEFIDKVLYFNPKAKFINRSSSFDLDQ